MWSTRAPLSEPSEEDMGHDEHAGAAKRRRERRLRQFLRHEGLTVAMVLSEKKHHTSRGQRKDRYALNCTAKVRKTPPPAAAATEYYPLTEDEGGGLAAGGRPPALVEPRPQVGIQQHAGIGYELVLALDPPVLQMGEEVGDYDFLHCCLPDHPEQLIVQEIPVPSSVDCATQPMDVEHVLNVPVLHFHDEDLALSLFLEQVFAQEVPEVRVPSSGASLSTASG